jgi:hypothetical protein
MYKITADLSIFTFTEQYTLKFLKLFGKENEYVEGYQFGTVSMEFETIVDAVGTIEQLANAGVLITIERL